MKKSAGPKPGAPFDSSILRFDSSSASKLRALELDARADLQLARRVAGAVTREHEERALRVLVAARIGEVRVVRQVEDVGRKLQTARTRERDPVAEAHVELEESRATRAVTLAVVVLERERVVGPECRVAGDRKRLGLDAVQIRIDRAVGQRERIATQGARHPAQ